MQYTKNYTAETHWYEILKTIEKDFIMSQNPGNLKHQNMSDGVKKSWEDPVVRAQRSKREWV